MYSTVRKMPVRGSFIRIWSNNSHIWSDTFKWQHGVLYLYDAQADDWEKFPLAMLDWNGGRNVRYIIIGED